MSSDEESDCSESDLSQSTHSRKRDLSNDAETSPAKRTKRRGPANSETPATNRSASPIASSDTSETSIHIVQMRNAESVCERKADTSKSWLDATPPLSDDLAWKCFKGNGKVSNHAVYDILDICKGETIVLIEANTAMPLVRRLQVEVSSGYTGLVIGPIQTQEHWAVAVGDVQSHKIRFYNSLEEISTDIEEALNTLKNESQVAWTLHNTACEQQRDGESCGLYLCWFALRESARKPHSSDVNVELCRCICILLLGGESRSLDELSHQMNLKEVQEAIDILQYFHDNLAKRQKLLHEVQSALIFNSSSSVISQLTTERVVHVSRVLRASRSHYVLVCQS